MVSNKRQTTKNFETHEVSHILNRGVDYYWCTLKSIKIVDQRIFSRKDVACYGSDSVLPVTCSIANFITGSITMFACGINFCSKTQLCLAHECQFAKCRSSSISVSVVCSCASSFGGASSKRSASPRTPMSSMTSVCTGFSHSD
ncbi:hypothetical protein OUZ56_003253 [Daphnia magna]|uniref:Uncharacterized protein n=1 Tax=Daphnia magna TaxID=35525 RepID=A0ABR0A873_9CRUS|nr:hypothetical protein OUZ56_003253 [Daphnia magna]